MRFQTFAPPPIYVDTPQLIETAIRDCLDAEVMLGVDTETLGLFKNEDGSKRFNMTDEVVVMGLSPRDDVRYLVPRVNLNYFRPVLESDVPKALTFAKFDVHRIMNSSGIKVGGPWIDTVVLDFLVDEDRRENRHGLKDCMADYFDYPMNEYKELFGSEDPRAIKPGHPAWQKYLDYSSLDPWATRILAMKLFGLLDKIEVWPADDENDPYTLTQMYWDTEEPQLKTLWGMERRGMRVNVDHLKKVRAVLEEKMEETAFEINKLVGYPINPNSTDQMGEYFFNVKKYTPLSFTEKKQVPQVNETLFSHLALGKTQDPVAKLVMVYKKCSKLRGTYVDGILKFLFLDGRVHTDYSPTKTTGRLGSSNPNLQNVPQITKDDPYRIREAFLPEEGNAFIIGDYSQLEMRIIADMSGDETMINAILDGRDMHIFTVSTIENADYDECVAARERGESWIEEKRTAMKKTGFGILYGESKVGLAAQLSEELGRYVSQDEAQTFINQYLNTYPGVRRWIAEKHYEAKSRGYVQTICGRFRRLSKAKYGRSREIGHALRQAQNAPIQGSAADIVKRAMINLAADGRFADLGWALIHQVHDELIGEGPIETASEAREIMEYYMSTPLNPPLRVPLVVKPKIAKNWAEK